ncbi:MAG: hypothetical protein QM813_25020 [Verrucomicrobiota bacterium]
MRYVIKSLLRTEGIAHKTYQTRFGCELATDIPQLLKLCDLGLAEEKAGSLQLNEEGLMWSDTIGPWLYSDAVVAQMEAYDLA